MNMFRRKDSTILSALNIMMLGTIFIMVLPFYAHPQLNLVLNSTGLTPTIHHIVHCCNCMDYNRIRDKPWLLVLGSLFLVELCLVCPSILPSANQSNAWEILTTGSGDFTKNKIFGTIAEASAPSRGLICSLFGPIVFVLAIVMGIIALWDGIVRRVRLVILGMWVIVAAYMAWSAGRFLFNAAPAIVIGLGVVTLWGKAVTVAWPFLGEEWVSELLARESPMPVGSLENSTIQCYWTW